ncbi:ATP-binding SpoIIE family protein phosphatase [Thiospirillum jenense]|uniref:SpoIIE family protein phosphatase n=1 Tax=Thiospirillum jenense TaxID=1653858 RepID=A0A839HJ52_9GAMM|nr:SpoIIE family protein phosphatase [Thiospirillum jenense]MBB1127026.1 SpoIIE family protein phosphatase [Thiospirillum jenense]
MPIVTHVPPGMRGTALIVDDEPANCRLLTQMLRREGFATHEAYDGYKALELFAQHSADIVFMDVMMPRMDGFETTRQLKQMAGVNFVPVIFLTALRDEKSLIECTEAGGDDFLTKPFSLGILKARIKAMERVRDLQRTIHAKNVALSALLEQDREEQELAERVFTRAVNANNVRLDNLNVVLRPAALFSGDVILTQHAPDGGLRILVGDFTGHGLAAAIGALPVADVFHTMTRKGVDERKLLAEINRKLYQMLPADRFMAACLISISGHDHQLRWWNGGMPSGWLRTQTELLELESYALPLGILPELGELGVPRCLTINTADRLLLMSDGLVEANNSDEQMFGDQQFKKLLVEWQPGEAMMPRLITTLDAHIANAEQRDDIAIVELPLNPSLFAATHPLCCPLSTASWCWLLELHDERLVDMPTLGQVLQPLGLLNGIEPHLGPLQTIVSELYTNALEHGILGLDSRMKATQEGFEEYYLERARRLVDHCHGQITLRLCYEPHDPGGCIHIMVRDSGPGFDSQHLPTGSIDDAVRFWGRGIPLVRDLCQSVTYSHNGAQVEAVYVWHTDEQLPYSTSPTAG